MKSIGWFTLTTIVIGIVTNLLTTQIENKFGVANIELTEKVLKDIPDEREIKITSFEFSLKKHKWYVRLGGIILLVFPWFVTPFGGMVEKAKKDVWLIGARTAGLAKPIREKVINEFARNFQLKVIPLLIIYLAVYYIVLWFIGNHFDIATIKYSFLSIERIFNFALSFI